VQLPALPIGDAVASMLSAIGITKDRVKKVLRTNDCGCTGRQRALNQLGEKISAAASRVANAVLNAAVPSPYTPDDVAAVATAMAQSPGTNPGLLGKPSKRKSSAVVDALGSVSLGDQNVTRPPLYFER